MELRQLKNFYEIARQKSITRAASTLNISQPALSISMKNLENELGVKLLARDGHQIKITEAGTSIIPNIEKMLSLEDDILSSCNGEKNKKAELRIDTSIAQPLLIEVLSHFTHDYPNVRIKLITDEEKEGKPDIALSSYINEGNIQTGKDSAITLKEELVVAVPRILMPVYKGPITMDYLLENQLIGLNDSNPLCQVENYYIDKYNLNIKHTIICDNPSIMTKLLINGTGIAFVPSKSWLLQNNPSLNLIPLEYSNWSYYITIRATDYRNNNEIKQIFMEYVREYLGIM